jgi:DNA-binding beta-propeller fold protein YncE
MAVVLAGLVMLGAVGCQGTATPEPGKWIARQTNLIAGFDVPECVVVDPESGAAYVSNIETPDQSYWADDGKGFISRISARKGLEELRWRDSTKEVPLNAPKGMCILNSSLYVADNTRVVRLPLVPLAPAPKVIDIPGAKRLNDMVSANGVVYVSDTETGNIFRIGSGAEIFLIKGPPSANGITFFQGKMFAVSWDKHEVYELDPTGNRDPMPFGLASQFKNLDGIEVLDDGTFVVSDFTGNRVATIDADRKTVRTIIRQVESPADIGLDRAHNILYVPQVTKNRVSIYRLVAR